MTTSALRDERPFGAVYSIIAEHGGSSRGDDRVVSSWSFLAGDDPGYITGHTLVIDGGWTAR
jgi:NAD(P)-dependent dehydrogenase (short-subunit alcohol dehydrogenase family)